MATKSQSPTAFSRLSRIGAGLGLKSPRIREEGNGRRGGGDEDWHIPYNGPVEAPREPPRRPKQRDSWGDPLYGEEDDDMILADQETLDRYGSHDNHGDHDWQHHEPRSSREDPEGRPRDRAYSVVSGRTVSSGAVDPGRNSVLTVRRSTVSSVKDRPPVPSYVNLGGAGGVGESPMPIARNAKETKIQNRGSLASIFTFGVPMRNSRILTSPVRSPSQLTSERPPSRKLARPNSSRGNQGIVSPRLEQAPLRDSTSMEANRNNTQARNKPLPPLENGDARDSLATDDEDYYNSYYSTLLNTPATTKFRPHTADATLRQPPSPFRQATHRAATSKEQSSRQTKTGIHPYAYVFPSASSAIPDAPQSAPPNSTSQTHLHTSGPSNQRSTEPPRLTFTEPPHASSAQAPNFSMPRVVDHRLGQLKSSASTPNLRSASQSPQGRLRPGKTLLLPRGKERWLSAETWCDALLFPRPRLKLKSDTLESSNRIVSPPASPLGRDFGNGMIAGSDKPPGMVSRVLAHSRSLVDLANAAEASSPAVSDPPSPYKRDIQTRARGATLPSRKAPPSPTPAEPVPAVPQPPPTLRIRPPRPQSFAQDDLALLSPAPSLARVLEEGQVLDHQRKKWQAQAEKSFQNQLSRNISRSRSKSLSAKQGRLRQPGGGHEHQGSISFLAARSLLGNQDMIPVLPARQKSSSHTGTDSIGHGTFGKSSHSHSNSLSKTLSKSSKTHSRGHSRNDSWGKSALMMAKNTVAICGLSEGGVALTPPDERANALEGALRREGTRVIRLADPAQIPLDKGVPLGVNGRGGPSPVPSSLSDARVGIALSTPPLVEDIRLASHPYAQGGYSYAQRQASPEPRVVERGSDYAGPHPISTKVTAAKGSTELPDVSARHRLPPQASLHPYAQTSPHDSFDGKIHPLARADSDVSPSAKMWAQLGSGDVREILPSDIQYSPFLVDRRMQPESVSASSSRNSNPILDTVGVGEALAYAVRPKSSKDSGLGTSETHEEIQETSGNRHREQGPSQVNNGTSSLHRVLVQYDASRPSHLQISPRTQQHPAIIADTPSPLPEPMAPSYNRESDSATLDERGVNFGLSPNVSSEYSSPQHSPRPIGSPDDLENFHDLFFRPNAIRNSAAAEGGTALPRTPSLPWDVSPRSRRTGSGLTSLARQLSEELEQLNADRQRERTNSEYSQTSGRASHLGILGRRPTESSLDFVFEEGVQTSPPDDLLEEDHQAILAFQPTDRLPEDVESSRASSLMEKTDEDETQMFRVGVVESVATPPAVSSDHRISLTGQMAFAHDHRRHHPEDPQTAGSHATTLQLPSADPTRSSYMTTSTTSRMSGLSDFPVPPRNDMAPGHMSLLSSYFDEVLTQAEVHAPPHPVFSPATSSRRLTFGGDEDVDQLIATLSSRS